jgi:hypothetical protein
MVHPGKEEAWREKELAHCVSSKVREDIRKQQIELATFAQLL